MQTENIVKKEWDFFQRVQNEGGRADCQDNWPTFRIMRSSQMDSWSDALRESYWEDLLCAEQEGRNPLAEKYGYMERYTAPGAYEKIRNLLPAITEEKEHLVNRIAAIQLPWMEEYAEHYPKLAGKGRPIHREEETPWSTSAETYLRGELYTYSEKTLQRYLEFVEELQRDNRNLSEEIERRTVRMYGYPDLDAAERSL